MDQTTNQHVDISQLPTTEKVVQEIIDNFGEQQIKNLLRQMLTIREFEIQGESAYLEGFIGGFYHSYIGQEAIASAAVCASGSNNLFFASYRCHALAYLLNASLESMASELLGKASGCALGRGGSMHMCTPQLPGGFGIVGGQIPIAAGGAFKIKYLEEKDKLSMCFIGDGATVQGTFHETLNFASLHDLPLLLVIENNEWGMGTSVNKAVAALPIAEKQAPSYNISSFAINGFDIFNCLLGFQKSSDHVKNYQKPALLECFCGRFKGHSISDPNLYRSKDVMQKIYQKDPIIFAKNWLIKIGLSSEEEFNNLKNQCKQDVLEAFQKAKESKEPSIATLEEGVYAN